MLKSDERTDGQAEFYSLKTQVRDLVEDLYSANDISAAVDQLRALVDDLEEFADTIANLEDDTPVIIPMRAA